MSRVMVFGSVDRLWIRKEEILAICEGEWFGL